MTSLLLKFKSYLFVIIPTLVAALLAYLLGKERGSNQVVSESKDQAVKQAAEVAEVRVESVKVHSDVQNKVVSSSDSAVDDELLKWARPNSGDSSRRH